MLAIAQTTAYVLVGLIAGAASIAAAVLAFRANREATKVGAEQKATDQAIGVQGSLIDDLREERTQDREEIRALRTEVTALRLELAEAKKHHQQCEDERADLRRRLARLT